MAPPNIRTGTQPSPVRPEQTDWKYQRRSSRLTIEIPIEVISKGPQNTIRTEETRTVVVSAHGCGMPLKTGVLPGDTVVVIHKMSREEVICRVVMCRQQSKGGDWVTGVEFQSPSPRFWHIAFPPDDWDSTQRKQRAAPVVKK
jgi:hypothetical protein